MDNINVFFNYGLATLAVVFLFYFSWTFRRTANLWKSQNLLKQIHQIVYLALFCAMSVAIIFVLSKLFPATVFPPIRFSFQSVLVKFAGFAFGPITGIATAIITEIGVITFLPVYFEYKYLLVSICFGFFAGIIKVFSQRFSNPLLQIAIIFVLILIFLYFSIMFFITPDGENIQFTLSLSQIIDGLENKYFSFPNFNVKTIVFLLSIFAFALVFVALVVVLIQFLYVKKRKTVLENQKLKTLITIIALSVLSEYLVSVPISTTADLNFFGGANSSSGLLILNSALLFAPVKILVNTLVIYVVWISISPLIKQQQKQFVLL